MKGFQLALLVVLLTIACAAAAVSHRTAKLKAKFDWNHGLAAYNSLNGEIPSPRHLWKGWTQNTYPGGHPLATRRAVDVMIARATNSPLNLKYITEMYQTTLNALQKDQNDWDEFVKELVVGNFENEVRVNIDAQGSAKLNALAFALQNGWYGKRPDLFGPDHKHSKFWKQETGYSSANPIHSMLVEAKPHDPQYTQMRSFSIMISFVKEMISKAITLLRQERGKGRTDAWKEAIRAIGSVLHTLQDSAVACTPRHWTITDLTGQDEKDSYSGGMLGTDLSAVRTCLEGDGHSILKKVGTRYLVAGMGNTEFYDGRHPAHAALDAVYENGRFLSTDQLAACKTRKCVNDLYDQNTHALWGDNDPAFDGGVLLLEIAHEAYFPQHSAAAAADLLTKHFIESRYVDPSKLRIPTIREAEIAKELKVSAYDLAVAIDAMPKFA